MLCRDIHQLAAGLVQPFVDDCVGTFAVKRQLALWTPHCIQKCTYMKTNNVSNCSGKKSSLYES